MQFADRLKQRTRYFVRGAVDSLEGALRRRLWRPRPAERLGRACPTETGRWLTSEERELIGTLTSLVLPSDGGGPGAREAGIVDRIERRLAELPERQQRYSRGLWSLDRLARREMRRAFTEWDPREQEKFVRKLEGIAGSGGAASAASRLASRAKGLYYEWRLPAVSFLAELIDDTLQAFYTSPVAWEWLGYDGPPMPLGYLDPARRRA